MEATTTRKLRLMSWPSPQDYNESMQVPRTNLIDEELANGVVLCDERGLPRPVSGNFATVYRVRTNKHEWAVRCFLHEIPDQQQRYELIERFLRKIDLPYFVPFAFQANSILVDGTSYPLLKMRWCEGKSLDRHIDDLVAADLHGISELSGGPTTSQKISELADQWLQMMNALQEAGVAHGDLQHGNVLVENERLVLVDYDGMFVPGMEGLASPELGHANYQHPGRRKEYFDHTLDNFSGWLIYAALKCLAIDLNLWHGSPGKECLLFNRNDLKEPQNSLIFRRLCSHSSTEIRHYAACLKYFLKLNPQEVPPVCPDYFIVSELATGKDEPDIAKENEDRNRQRLRESREGLLLFSLPLSLCSHCSFWYP